jgi:hypothetical protein
LRRDESVELPNAKAAPTDQPPRLDVCSRSGNEGLAVREAHRSRLADAIPRTLEREKADDLAAVLDHAAVDLRMNVAQGTDELRAQKRVLQLRRGELQFLPSLDLTIT